MTIQQLNTADSTQASPGNLGRVAAGGDGLSATQGEPASGELKDEPAVEAPQKPSKASKGTSKGPGKAAGKPADDRGPAPPLPKPLATFNL